MDNLVISFTLYLLAANLVAGSIYIFGRQRAGLLALEYPFIYTPWLALQLLMPGFATLPGIADNNLSLKYFLFMVQGFSCGVMGGCILLPRLFFRPASVAGRLKVTVISAAAVTLLYLVSRMLLLEAFRFLLPRMA